MSVIFCQLTCNDHLCFLIEFYNCLSTHLIIIRFTVQQLNQFN
jgi:hypothetical protein